MATILPIQTMQQPQQQYQQPSMMGGQSGQPAQDPLFEALARYITSGPGPSSYSSDQIQTIIDSHVNNDGGRAYLESIVLPPPMPHPKEWKNHAQVSGYLSTNMNSLSLQVEGQRNMLMQRIIFKGKAMGFFMMQVIEIDPENATLFWDELTDSQPVTFRLNYHPDMSILTVTFHDHRAETVGELLINQFGAGLPRHTIEGTGRFRLPDFPQT